MLLGGNGELGHVALLITIQGGVCGSIGSFGLMQICGTRGLRGFEVVLFKIDLDVTRAARTTHIFDQVVGVFAIGDRQLEMTDGCCNRSEGANRIVAGLSLFWIPGLFRWQRMRDRDLLRCGLSILRVEVHAESAAKVHLSIVNAHAVRRSQRRKRGLQRSVAVVRCCFERFDLGSETI